MSIVNAYLETNEFYRTGKQAGVNEFVELLRGKVSPDVLYAAFQQYTQDLNLKEGMGI